MAADDGARSAAGWAELNRRFGTKPLAELFAPAISYAEEGYPVPVNVARQWERDSRRIAKAMAENAAPHEYWWQSFMKPDGTPYRAVSCSAFRTTPRRCAPSPRRTARAITAVR